MLVAQESDCLLLDEPISARDIAHQIEVMALVKRLSEQRGIGVVVVLHDINMAGRFCDELIALKDGGLLASGPAAEMMRPQTLTEIFGIPMTTLIRTAPQRPLASLCSRTGSLALSRLSQRAMGIPAVRERRRALADYQTSVPDASNNGSMSKAQRKKTARPDRSSAAKKPPARPSKRRLSHRAPIMSVLSTVSSHA
nr:hypothetical protein [Paraburkholderia flagellata]